MQLVTKIARLTTLLTPLKLGRVHQYVLTLPLLAAMVFHFAQTENAHASEPIKVIEARIATAHPTQGALGYREVKRKAKKYRNKNKKEKEEFRKLKTAPAVIGPNGQLYIIDHHHSLRALQIEGQKFGYFKIMADLSHLGIRAFWSEMVKRNWAHPYNENGRRISPLKIPSKIARLPDDPYRSLAGRVRDRGGFTRTTRPFEEFYWANIFRQLKLLEDVDLEDKEEFLEAVDQAIEIRREQEGTQCLSQISGN